MDNTEKTVLPMSFSIGDIIKGAEHLTATIGKVLPKDAGTIDDIAITEDEMSVALVLVRKMAVELKSPLLKYLTSYEIPTMTQKDGNISLVLTFPDPISASLCNIINDKIWEYFVNGLAGQWLNLKNIPIGKEFIAESAMDIDDIRSSINLSQSKRKTLTYNWY